MNKIRSRLKHKLNIGLGAGLLLLWLCAPFQPAFAANREHQQITGKWLAEQILAPVHPPDQPTESVTRQLSKYCLRFMRIRVFGDTTLSIAVVSPRKVDGRFGYVRPAGSTCHDHKPAGPAVKATVLMLPGYRLSKSTLLPYSAAIAANGYRAILVDLPAQGESTGLYIGYGQLEAKALVRLLGILRRTGIVAGKVGIFGVSYGAAVAVETAAMTKKITAVVAIAPFAHTVPTIQRFIGENYPEAAASITPATFDEAIKLADRTLGYDLARDGPVRYAPMIQAPTLYLAGSKDKLVPLRDVELLAKKTPNSRLSVIDGAGHFDMVMDASNLATEVGAWFLQEFRLSAREHGHE